MPATRATRMGYFVVMIVGIGWMGIGSALAWAALKGMVETCR